MKKDIKLPKEYRLIAGSNYIVLPDWRVARLLTPTIRDGVTYYNLFAPKYTRLSQADVVASARAGKVTRASAIAKK